MTELAANEQPSPGTATPCPACAGKLYPKLLKCADCGLEVSTRYVTNEFAELEDDSLHLLRIFVLCEGRIRDMEAALGVSYPTVKARLAALRDRLGLAGGTMAPATPAVASDAAPAHAPTEPASVREVLDALESGTLDYDGALRRIRALRTAPQ